MKLSIALAAALAVALAVALGTCSCGPDTVCGQACEHMRQCGVSRLLITNIKSYAYDDDCGAVACDSITECVSRCIDAANCSALQSLTPNGPLHSCLIDCNSWFRITDDGAG